MKLVLNQILHVNEAKETKNINISGQSSEISLETKTVVGIDG